jgi:hypothetical protein
VPPINSVHLAILTLTLIQTLYKSHAAFNSTHLHLGAEVAPCVGSRKPRATSSTRSAPAKCQRSRLKNRNLALWILISRLWDDWRKPLALVQPETVIRWHRRGFRLYWRWKSRQKWLGRRKVHKEIRDLIRRMSRSNPLWSAPRIHGELLKLGIEISQATVSQYMARHYKPPSQSSFSLL